MFKVCKTITKNTIVNENKQIPNSTPQQSICLGA